MSVTATGAGSSRWVCPRAPAGSLHRGAARGLPESAEEVDASRACLLVCLALTGAAVGAFALEDASVPAPASAAGVGLSVRVQPNPMVAGARVAISGSLTAPRAQGRKVVCGSNWQAGGGSCGARGRSPDRVGPTSPDRVGPTGSSDPREWCNRTGAGTCRAPEG
jgi:hypothetical protein